MTHFRELIAVLSLVLLASAVLATDGAADMLYILPVVETLFVVLASVAVAIAPDLTFRRVEPFLSSVSLRAPPQP